MKFAKGKGSCMQPVNLQLDGRNSGTKSYHIRILQFTERNRSSHPTTKVAASPRLLLDPSELSLLV